MPPFRRFLILLLLCLLIPSGVASAQDEDATPEPEGDEGQAIITSPAPGDVLFGEVQVTGTAAHPEFRRFQLEFATADAPDDWLPVHEPVSQQVPAGILGVWNLSSLPDGVYALRLRVFVRDETWLEAVVEGLQVSNTQPTDIPTILPSPTDAPTSPPPTAGPTPTPIIWQPPTSTPRPGGGAAAVEGGGGSPGGQGIDWLSGGQVRATCCNGFYLTLVIVALVGAYMGIRSSLRPWLRRTFRRRR